MFIYIDISSNAKQLSFLKWHNHELWLCVVSQQRDISHVIWLELVGAEFGFPLWKCFASGKSLLIDTN